MVSDTLISEKYASMPDIELLHFASTEGHYLTAEGLLLLQRELERRNLPEGKIKGMIPANISADDIEQNEIKPFPLATWSYVFEEIENGKSNNEILPGLIETGIAETDALLLFSNVKTKAEKELQKAEVWRMTGILILVSGIAITFLPVTNNSNRLSNILAWCLILYGAGKAIKGLYYKAKFNRILKLLTRE